MANFLTSNHPVWRWVNFLANNCWNVKKFGGGWIARSATIFSIALQKGMTTSDVIVSSSLRIKYFNDHYQETNLCAKFEWRYFGKNEVCQWRQFWWRL